MVGAIRNWVTVEGTSTNLDSGNGYCYNTEDEQMFIDKIC